MHLRSTLLGNTSPVASDGNPGAQILGITCKNFDGNIDNLVRQTRKEIQSLFDTNKVTPGTPILLKDTYEGGNQPIWTPAIAAFVAITASDVCREHNTPMAVYVTDKDQFRTVQSNTPTVPTDSWFSAKGQLLNTQTTNSTDQRTANSGQREQTANASSQG